MKSYILNKLPNSTSNLNKTIWNYKIIMHWVIQKNLLNVDELNSLVSCLDSFAITYTFVKIIPFYHIMEPDLSIDNHNVMVVGSTAIGKIAAEKGWFPGYFGDNLDYSLYRQHYGEHLLNYDAVIDTLGNIQKKWDNFFIRPIDDKKSFAGTVMGWQDLLTMRSNIAKIDDDPDATLHLNDELVMASLKEIYAEYRFLVVDGKVTTGSRYKLGDKVIYSSQVDSFITDYAQSRVDDWQPNRAFVIDIAETNNGLKVIELNAINSSGYYACDMSRFVMAIENMVFN